MLADVLKTEVRSLAMRVLVDTYAGLHVRSLFQKQSWHVTPRSQVVAVYMRTYRRTHL